MWNCTTWLGPPRVCFWWLHTRAPGCRGHDPAPAQASTREPGTRSCGCTTWPLGTGRSFIALHETTPGSPVSLRAMATPGTGLPGASSRRRTTQHPETRERIPQLQEVAPGTRELSPATSRCGTGERPTHPCSSETPGPGSRDTFVTSRGADPVRWRHVVSNRHAPSVSPGRGLRVQRRRSPHLSTGLRHADGHWSDSKPCLSELR